MSAPMHTATSAVLVVVLSCAAAAGCPETPTEITAAFSVAEHLGSEQPGAIACIDAALSAHLGTPIERARLQLKTAIWLEQVARYAEARARLRAAEELLGSEAVDHERVAITAELGWVDFRLGHFVKAELALSSAEAAGSKLSELEHAVVLDHLGVIQRERSDYAHADQSFARALEISQNGAGESARRAQAQIYNDRGGLRSYQSDFRAAADDYQRALGLYRALGMTQTLEMARTLNNLGEAHRELGDTERARMELGQALDLKTTLLGPRNPGTASTLNNLGVLAEQSRDYVAAEAYYARALAIYEQTLGARHANVATVAVHYGRLEFTTGKYPAALTLLEQARSIRDQEFGPYSNWSAETLVDLGPLYSKVGQRGRARRGAERAVAIAAVSNEQELLYDGYMSYARVLADQAQPSAAIFFGKRAINVIQQMRERDLPPTKREQGFFLAQREYMYRDLADWLITVGRLPEAENVLDLLKTEELADFAELTAKSAESLTGRVGMARREVAAAAALDEAIQDLAAEVKGPNQTGAGHRRFIARLHEILATLGSGDSGPGSPRAAPRPSDDVDARPLAEPHVAVIRYLVLPGRVRILVRTHSGVVDRSVSIDRAGLNRQVLDMRRRLQSRADAADVSAALFRLLIAPIAPELTDVRRLVLVPDDILRYVPFAALHDGQAYLIESYALSLATPAALRSDPAAARPLRSAAAFGVSRMPDGQVVLPNVPAELRRVVRSSPQDRAGALPGVILLDGAFTRASVARTLAGGYPVVHIASHFVFKPGSLADSYLLLGDGTRLTLQVIETDALPLHGVEMLTLSACDTAIGDAGADGREIESFAALAQRHGVRSVLAALWSVPDLSTSVIMAKFYRLLADGQDSFSARAEALRAAQLLLLRGPAPSSSNDSQTRSPYADPFFWAAFTLLGSQT